MPSLPTIKVLRSSDRFLTEIDWLKSHHSFSFAQHWDVANTHHGLLLVSNDDIIQPGTGFTTHPHRDMEIITWVLDGELEHKDSEGHTGIIYPGLAQRMSAGTGIWHSEINPNKTKTVHLVQMWVVPDTERIPPGYEQLDINADLKRGGLVPVATGQGHKAAITIRQKGATLWVGRLKPGEVVSVPEAPFVHIFVAKGQADLESGSHLNTGDAARLTNAGALRLTSSTKTGAEILIWEMHTHLDNP